MTQVETKDEMSETGFTPGPWRVGGKEWDDWGMVRGADGLPVALCATEPRGAMEFKLRAKYGTPEWKEGPPEMAANARLIAASPTMYDLLRELVDPDGCWYDHHDYCQAHGLAEKPCPHERTNELLASLAR